jgi:Mg-chelatase subunit ChlI
LFADNRGDPLMRPEVVWGVLALTGSLLAGAAVIYAVDRWRKRAAAGTTDADTAAELTSFRDMFESGEITEAEYAELRRRVATKMKKPPPVPSTSIDPAPAGAAPSREHTHGQVPAQSQAQSQAQPAPQPPPAPPPAWPPESPPPPPPA